MPDNLKSCPAVEEEKEESVQTTIAEKDENRIEDREFEMEIVENKDKKFLALHKKSFQEIFPHGEKMLEILPDRSFIPDQWTLALLRGLSTVDFDGTNVIEVGVGSGVNIVHILSRCNPHMVTGIEYDEKNRPDVLKLANRNVRRLLPPEKWEKVSYIMGDLLSNIRDLNGVRGTVTESVRFSLEDCINVEGADEDLSFDFADRSGVYSLCSENPEAPTIIIGCIPQVPKQNGQDISQGDLQSHMYDEKKYESDMNLYGLGLNDVALSQAFELLKSGDKIILNLGGRPGIERLLAMFKKNYFKANVLHDEVIEQHVGTDISSLANMENIFDNKSDNFEFFSDQSGKVEISAEEANILMKNKQKVYHKIYVIEGIKQ